MIMRKIKVTYYNHELEQKETAIFENIISSNIFKEGIKESGQFSLKE